MKDYTPFGLLDFCYLQPTNLHNILLLALKYARADALAAGSTPAHRLSSLKGWQQQVPHPSPKITDSLRNSKLPSFTHDNVWGDVGAGGFAKWCVRQRDKQPTQCTRVHLRSSRDFSFDSLHHVVASMYNKGSSGWQQEPHEVDVQHVSSNAMHHDSEKSCPGQVAYRSEDTHTTIIPRVIARTRKTMAYFHPSESLALPLSEDAGSLAVEIEM